MIRGDQGGWTCAILVILYLGRAIRAAPYMLPMLRRVMTTFIVHCWNTTSCPPHRTMRTKTALLLFPSPRGERERASTCRYLMAHSTPSPAVAAAPQPSNTIPVTSTGLRGSTTLNPNPALIPPNNLVPVHIRSEAYHVWINVDMASRSLGGRSTLFRRIDGMRLFVVRSMILGVRADDGGVYHIPRIKCRRRGRMDVYSRVRGMIMLLRERLSADSEG